MLAALLDPRRHYGSYRELARLVRRRWELVLELTKHEISERYAGQVFGTLWAIGHPLITVAIYVVVFGFIFGGRGKPDPSIPLDQTTYLLAGLVPWIILAESLSKTCGLIVNNTPMVKQLVFPVEVLPIKSALASMLSLVVGMIFVVVYAVASSRTVPPPTYLLLPVVMAMQFLFMVGLGFALSAIAPFFRDLKDFVTVFLGFGMFISPILYFRVNLPRIFEFLIAANPFSCMIWVYQDILYFGRIEHPNAWAAFVILTLGTFSVGYRFFMGVKHAFADVL
ncbi:MAG TPA: ABC transporter permease [Aliidongia sp.]|nr:ABC transporter permease [Aliidongia sp.]